MLKTSIYSLQRKWFFTGHLIVGLFLLAGTVFFQIVFKTPHQDTVFWAYGLLVIFFTFQIVLNLFEHKIFRSYEWVSSALIFDSLLISIWLFKFPNENSFIVFLYLIIILMASLIFFSKGGVAIAGLCCFWFALLSFWHKSFYGDFWISWAVYSLIFLSVGLVGGYLSTELRKVSERLGQKNLEIQRITLLFEKIIEGMPTGLLIVDKDMKLAFMNPGAELILAKKQEDVLGKNLESIEPDLLPFFEKLDSEKIEDESDDQRSTGIETELTATGTQWHRSVFLSAKLNQGSARIQQTVELGNGKNKRLIRGDVAEMEMGSQTGEFFSRVEGVGRVLLFQDVTKLVHLEDKLKQHEKLAAVGQLAAGIAHEIRNPLASMSGSVQMLQQNSGQNNLSQEDQKLMSIIKKEIDRLNGLVNEFLSFVKPDQFETETVTLDKLLSDIYLQALNKKTEFQGLVIEQELKTGIKAQGNSERLTQVAWNLITNAFQAMKGPGKITIGCDEVSPHWVSFWVEDTGEGMTEETLQHLYEPFFTTKPKGTGLGLATVYKIIEAHRGEIRVQSKKGEGTRFEVHLPKA